MAEKHRELATSRLLDIIRRGAASPVSPPGKPAAPTQEDLPEQVPRAVDKPDESAHPPPKAVSEVPKPALTRKKEDSELLKEILSRPDAATALKQKIPSPKKSEAPKSDESLTDAFMPVSKRVAKRLKSALSDIKFPTRKTPVPEIEAEKKAARAKVKTTALKVRVKGKHVFGLDIGTSSIKVVEVVKSGSDCSVLSVGIHDIPQGMRENQAGLDVLLTKTIREMLSADKLKNVGLHVLLPDRNTQVRRIDLPEIAPKERLNAIKFQINRDLPFPVEVCEVSYSGLDPKVKGRQEIEVLAIDRRELDRRIDILDEIGLAPTHLTSTPVTMKFLIDGYKGIEINKGAIAIADIGAAKTTISIIENRKVILCRTVATGSDDFSEVLYGLSLKPNGEELSKTEAEEYKIEHGLMLEGTPETMRVAILMRPVAERISAEISRSLDFYSREKGAGALQKLILIGGGALMKRLPEFLSEHLGVVVEVGDPMARIELAPTISEEDRKIIEERRPAFLPALSIALDDSRTHNVLPPELKTAERLKGAKRIIPPVALSIIVAMLALYALALSELNATESDHDKLKKKLTGLVRHRTDYLVAKAQVDKLQTQLIQRGEDFAVIAEKAPEIPKYLQLLSNIVPSFIYLDRLRTRYIVDPKAMEEPPEPGEEGVSEEKIPEAFKPTYDRVLAELLGKGEEEQIEMKKRHIYGKVLEIDGTVYRQGTLTDVKLTNFIYDLENSGWFREVAIDSFERTVSGMIKFKVICGL